MDEKERGMGNGVQYATPLSHETSFLSIQLYVIQWQLRFMPHACCLLRANSGTITYLEALVCHTLSAHFKSLRRTYPCRVINRWRCLANLDSSRYGEATQSRV